MAKKLERLLVIEDTLSHLADARRIFDAIKGLKTEYAKTVEEAIDDESGKLYKEAPSDFNPEFREKIKQFQKQKGFPQKGLTEKQDEVVGKYASQLESQGIPRFIGGEITPLVDGVITDLFVPISNRGLREINEGPNGLVVAATCQRLKIPYIICTAGYHHGSKYNWANHMHRAMGGPEMIDNGGSESEAEHKDWKSAYKVLKEIVEK